MTNILNEKKQAAIHLVTELNKVAVLEVMGRHKEKIDILQGGEHGRTALHIAAIYDHEECARILVSLPRPMVTFEPLLVTAFVDIRFRRLSPPPLQQRLLPHPRGGEKRLLQDLGDLPPVGGVPRMLPRRNDLVLRLGGQRAAPLGGPRGRHQGRGVVLAFWGEDLHAAARLVHPRAPGVRPGGHGHRQADVQDAARGEAALLGLVRRPEGPEDFKCEDLSFNTFLCR
jgi:ankyrin repeat protein